MRAVVETFGAEAVVAWVRNNLSRTGYPAQRGAVGAAPARTPNQVLFQSGGVLMEHGKPAAAAAAPSDSDSDSSSDDDEQVLRNPASRPPPKGRGLLAGLWA